jgi:S1-C subfamily serine protease
MTSADPVLLTVTPVASFNGQQPLTQASGFFFERDDRLFLVTSRHVVSDEATGHRPDRIAIRLHTDTRNLAAATGWSMLLYRNGRAVWRQGRDAGGAVDIAVVEVDRDAMPPSATWQAFRMANLSQPADTIELGSALLVIGFPLGFEDTLHNVPVVRQAVLASTYGLRFQGQGYFLTDARTHRGSSGAPVVRRLRGAGADRQALPWLLLGVHSARLDMGGRDLVQDESLGLNCTWYADILDTLTASGPR